MLRRVASQKFTDVSEMLTASMSRLIVLIAEAVRTFQKSVGFCDITRSKIPEYRHINIRRRENMKFL
jgi:hypothetical protein